MALPTDKQARKERPIARGVLDYFPDAIAAVANVSYVGNQQHNPGEPMHWSRGKSNDHADCIGRHLIERGTVDDDGVLHSAKAAWRALAMLQIELEEGAAQDPRDESEKAFDAAYFPEPTPLVLVPDTVSSTVANETYGERYGVDWEYKGNPEKTETVFADWDNPLDQYTITVPATEPADAMSYDQRQDFDRLQTLGCTDDVAGLIVQGTSHGVYAGYVYVAGPMRGYEKYNFPAFDAARDEFLRWGWSVISPADIDRAHDADTETLTAEEVALRTKQYVYRDFYALYFIAHQPGGSIAMLPGWEKSTGAVAEFFLARWLGMRIYNAHSGNLLRDFSVADLVATVQTFLLNQKED